MPEELRAKVRHLVSSRAGERCEYCLLPEDRAAFPHEVDHILSRKHGGHSEPENLAYCCFICNRYKGTDIASRNRSGLLVRLFDPRQDTWSDHFRLAGPVIEPLTDIGEITARLLRFNTAERVVERRLLQSLGRYPRQ